MVSCTWFETNKMKYQMGVFATCYCWIMELIPAKNTCNYVTCVCNLCAKLSGLSEAEYCCSSNLISNLSIFSDIIFILWDQNLKLKFDDVLSGKALIILETRIKVLPTRPWPALTSLNRLFCTWIFECAEIIVRGPFWSKTGTHVGPIQAFRI